VVLDGLVAVIDDYGYADERLIGVHGAARFLGELGLLTGHAAFFTGLVVEPGEELVVPVARVRALSVEDRGAGRPAAAAARLLPAPRALGRPWRRLVHEYLAGATRLPRDGAGYTYG
jgi:hypothetical protein